MPITTRKQKSDFANDKPSPRRMRPYWRASQATRIDTVRNRAFWGPTSSSRSARSLEARSRAVTTREPAQMKRSTG